MWGPGALRTRIPVTTPGRTAFQRRTHGRSPKYNNIACYNSRPLPQAPSSVASWSPQLRPDPRELLPFSSNTYTVFSARNVDPDDIPAESTFQVSRDISPSSWNPYQRIHERDGLPSRTQKLFEGDGVFPGGGDVTMALSTAPSNICLVYFI